MIARQNATSGSRVFVWLVQVILLCLMVFALYVNLWREGLAVLPEVEHFLERKASTLLGADVSLKQAEGYFVGFKPHVRVSSVRVRDQKNGASLLELHDVHVSLEFWNSLFRRSLVFERVHIQKVQVYPQVRGVIQRMALTPRLQWQRWVHLLLQQKQLLIHHFVLTYPHIEVRVSDIALRSDDAQKRHIQGRFLASVQGVETVGRLQLQTDRDLFLPDGSLNVFLDIAPLIPVRENTGLVATVSSGLQGVRAWLGFKAGELHTVRLQSSTRGSFLQGLHFDLEARQRKSDIVENDAAGTGWSVQGRLMQGIARSEFVGEWRDQLVTFASLSMPVTQLESVLRLVAPQVIAQVHVNGLLENVYFDGSALSADFDDIVVDTPVIKAGPFTGRFTGRHDFGHIALSDNLVNIEVPQFLRQTLYEIQAEPVDVVWTRKGAHHSVVIRDWALSHGMAQGIIDIRFEKEPLQRAQLALLANMQATAIHGYEQYLPLLLKPRLLNWLDQAFSAGVLRDGQILFHGPLRRIQKDRVLGITDPRVRPRDHAAVLDQIHNHYNHHHHHHHNNNNDDDDMSLEPRLQVVLAAEDVDFQFHPEWPSIVDADIESYIDIGGRVDLELHQGSSVSQFVKGRANFEIPLTDKKPKLHVTVTSTGSAAAGVEYLQQSPLAKHVSAVLPNIEVQGGQYSSDIDVMLHLADPLQPRVTVATDIVSGDVFVKPLQLQLSELQGHVDFNIEEGLSGEGIKAFVLGRQLEVDIAKADGQRTQVQMTGTMTGKRLAQWLEWPWLSVIDGETAYRGWVEFPWSDGPVDVQIKSDLVGMSIDLPGIFGKTVSEARDWRIAVQLADGVHFDIFDENRYRIQLPLSPDFAHYDFAHYSIAIGDTVYSLEHNVFGHFESRLEGRQLSVDLGQFALDEWLYFVKNMPDTMAVALLNSESVQVSPSEYSTHRLWQLLPRHFSLAVADVRYQDLSLGDFRVSSYREPGGWRMQWDGHSAVGYAFIPHDLEADPVRIIFDRFMLPQHIISRSTVDEITSVDDYREDTGASDDTGDFSSWVIAPESWPSVELKIERILIDQQDLGRFELSGAPVVGGYTVPSLYGQLAGLHFRGDGHISGLHGSEYQLELRGGQLNQVFSLLHSLDYLESNKVLLSPSSYYGHVSLSWPNIVPEVEALQGVGSMMFEQGVIKGVDGVSPIKWLSLLSAERFTRRLRLDFTDISNTGLAFDQLKLRWQQEGLRFDNQEFSLQSPSLEFRTKGWVDFQEKQLFQECVAIIPLIDHLLLPAAAAGGLPAAATAYVLDKALGETLDKLTKVTWQVQGDLQSPKIVQPAGSGS